MRLPLQTLTGILLLAAALPAAAGERLLVIPFENVTRSREARALVMREVERALVVQGHEVVAAPELEEFLRSRRIRFLDSLTHEQVRDLLASHGAAAIVMGTVLVYDTRADDPGVALALRVIGPGGKIVWSEVTGLRSSETAGAFGLGRLTEMDALVRRAISENLSSLPRERIRWTYRRTDRGEGLRVFASRALRGRSLRICVLPLVNYSDASDAPRIVEASLLHGLSERHGLQAVAPADLRRGIVESALRAPSHLSPEQYRTLGKALGTPLFLRGSILSFGRAIDADGTQSVEIELYLSLVDVETGRILWSGLHRRTGLDYEGPFRTGAIRDSTRLADRVVSELLGAFARH